MSKKPTSTVECLTNYLNHHENGIFTPCGQEIVGFLLPSLVQDEQTENFPYRLSRNYVKIFLVEP